MEQKNLEADQLLINEALKGEEEAFIQLYHRYVSPLYYFVFQKVGNTQDAEDIVSETYFQALKNLQKYSFKASFKNWLFGIAKHLVLAHYRQKYNKSTIELEENIIIETIEEDEGKLQNDTNSLAQILTLLPENYRQVLELRFLKGYSVIETAQALGITEENAKVLQHRALKKANENALKAAT